MRIVSLISYTVYSHLQEEDLDEKKDLKSSEKNESHIWNKYVQIEERHQ